MNSSKEFSVGPSVKGELRDLYTPYASALEACDPLPEYPRPQLVREDDTWLNLNGRWRYAIRKGALPAVSRNLLEVPEMDGEILVPFSPESLLSGVQRKLLPDEILYYEKVIDTSDLPRNDKNGRLRIHFGAVDQSCQLYVNGRFVGENHGGYFNFSFEITRYIHAGLNYIHLLVVDPSQTGDWAYGKQTLERGKIWYSPSSGIWQTVWLEAVPASFISQVRTTPDLEKGKINLEVCIEHPLSNVIQGEVYTEHGTVPFKVKNYLSSLESAQLRIYLEADLADCRAWTPEDPYLYDYSLTYGTDKVRSYFGMRSFGVAKDAQGNPRLTLNGKPYNHVGVLDQGYWSDGMYTAASDQALIDDIQKMKNLGFNMLRKHIKIEAARWYYHCDRLGILVWQDMVSGGGPYKPSVIAYLPFISIFLDDTKNYRRFGRASLQSRENFELELERTIEQLYSVTSLAVWVPFNEGWGQFDSARIRERVLELDATRVVDHASGWHDQFVGDLKSRHVYFKKVKLKADKLSRPQALSEFGGYSFAIPEHSSSAKVYGYKPYKSLTSYQEGVIALFDSLLSDLPCPLAATVYTQLSDVEDETNGILTYDRQQTKWPEASPAALALKERLEALKRI